MKRYEDTHGAGAAGIADRTRTWLLAAGLILMCALASTALAQKGKPGGGGGDGGGTPADPAIVYLADGNIKVMDADGANQTLVLPASRSRYLMRPSWHPNGQQIIFYQTDGPNITGPGAFYRVNLDGTGLTQIVALEQEGATTRARSEMSPFPGAHGLHRLGFSDKSADGSAYVIYVVNEDGTGLTQLTTAVGPNRYYPTWSPDGQHLAYLSSGDGGLRLLTLGEDQNGNIWAEDDALLLQTGFPDPDGVGFWWIDLPASFSKTTNKLYFAADNYTLNTADVWALHLDDWLSPAALERLTNTPARERDPSGSADDSQIAYAIDGTIYVANSDGSDPVALPRPVVKRSLESHARPSFKR
jgi:Tol biopolymer transport system component